MYRWIQKEDEIAVYGLVTRYGPRTSYWREWLKTRYVDDYICNKRTFLLIFITFRNNVVSFIHHYQPSKFNKEDSQMDPFRYSCAPFLDFKIVEFLDIDRRKCYLEWNFEFHNVTFELSKRLF